MVKEFTLRVLLFGVFLSCWLIPFYYTRDYPENTYLRALELKNGLLSRADSNRILLVGGSNLTFGINSEFLSMQLSRPVVNMSVHAGLGYEFMVAQVIESIDSGDLVLISPEYSLFFRNTEIDNTHYRAMNVCATCFNFIKKSLLPRVLIGAVLDKLKYNVNSIINSSSEISTIYRSDGFNSYGDLMSHLDDTVTRLNQKDIQLQKYESELSEDFLKSSKELFMRAAAMDATVYFLLPAICESGLDITTAQRVLKELRANSFRTLGEAGTFSFADSLFFDTIYHLNKEGRQVRTELLISTLKEASVI